MSKVASYLQEHISGEVSVDPYILSSVSRDGSIFQVAPEMVIYPRNTNDIRKVARFCWQLAERGHTMAITPRGNGSDTSGAAIGKGIILSLQAHMNAIFEFESRQRLVRVQPGANARSLNDALWLHGASIPSLPDSSLYGTIGGAIANNTSGSLAGKYGQLSEWVEQLEVVLSNGEVIQTGRINRRELNRKKGLETLEGEVYRSLDNLIDDNSDLVKELADRTDYTNAGYASIASVRRKDGSFDLTPLIIGSQGTLGIISEMILKATYTSSRLGAALALFEDKDALRDCIPALAKLNPAFLESYDAALVEQAAKGGKKFDSVKNADFKVEAALLIGFDELRDRRRRGHLKKAAKLIEKTGGTVTIADNENTESITAIRDVLFFAGLPSEPGISAPPVLHGIFVPAEQYSVFAAGIAALETKYRLKMPIFGRELSSLYYMWPAFNLKKTSDKQKLFKLLDDVMLLVEKTGGELIGDGGEGRLKGRFAEHGFDEDTISLFASVKNIFDPYGILNPGVKQSLELKQLAAMVADSYEHPALPNHIPRV